jgi:hypothetical protein
MVDRKSQIWIATYSSCFALEVSKRKSGTHPKSLRAIEADAANLRTFCARVADMAAGDVPPTTFKGA